jgi:hypothetical protein
LNVFGRRGVSAADMARFPEIAMSGIFRSQDD